MDSSSLSRGHLCEHRPYHRNCKCALHHSHYSTPPPSHLLLMELKHRILAALNKLSDRDTHHLAVDDLHRIVEMLSPEGIAMCLSCIYDTDAPQKSAAKKECVKMFGTLALLHGARLYFSTLFLFFLYHTIIIA